MKTERIIWVDKPFFVELMQQLQPEERFSTDYGWDLVLYTALPEGPKKLVFRMKKDD